MTHVLSIEPRLLTPPRRTGLDTVGARLASPASLTASPLHDL